MATRTLAETVGRLAGACDWQGVGLLLSRSPPQPQPYFLDTELLGAILDHKDQNCKPDQAAYRQRVLMAFFQPIPLVADYVNRVASKASTLARRGAPAQVDQLLLDIRNAVWFFHIEQHIAANMPEGTLFVPRENSTVALAELLRQLSAATLAKITPRTVRTFAASGPFDENEDFETLQVLLTRRPDLDPNALQPDGAPAWYTPHWRYVLEVTDYDFPPIPRIDVNTPFVMDGVKAPLLEHVLRKLAKDPDADMELTQHDVRSLLENGAEPIDPDVAVSKPISSLFARVVLPEVTDDLDWHEENGLSARGLAKAGVLPRPKDVAAMAAILGPDSPKLAEIMALYAGGARWHRRADAARALYDATQAGAGADAPGPFGRAIRLAQRARTEPQTDDVVARAFGDVRRSEASAAKPYELQNEYAQTVLGFLGGYRRKRRIVRSRKTKRTRRSKKSSRRKV